MVFLAFSDFDKYLKFGDFTAMAITQSQGAGKVRLIAKAGRFRVDSESANAERHAMRLLQFASSRKSSAGVMAIHEKNLADAQSKGLEDYYVEFDVTPDITESGSVSYYEEGNIRGPSSILMYMGSPSRTFSINAKLVARTPSEARVAQKKIHLLKSWRMPESYAGGVVSGSPALLYLQGYGKMFKDIPVVITDLSIDFSSEYNAITTGESGEDLLSSMARGYSVDGKGVTVEGGKDAKGNQLPPPMVSRQFEYQGSATAVPIIVPVNISLKEAHSVEGSLEGLEGFDILNYRNGILHGW
jgi:hypothetical protein